MPNRPADESQIREAIAEWCGRRGCRKTVCPSEVARAIAPETWRDRMDDVRRVARVMVREGVIEITQGGEAVDPARATGPIRLRLRNPN